MRASVCFFFRAVDVLNVEMLKSPMYFNNSTNNNISVERLLEMKETIETIRDIVSKEMIRDLAFVSFVPFISFVSYH